MFQFQFQFHSATREDAQMDRLVHRLHSTTASCWTAGLNLLFPPRCAYCDADLTGNQDQLLLCPDCRLALGPELWPCCQRCGAAGTGNSEPSDARHICRNTRLGFDTVVPLGSYRADLREAVLRMKRPAHDPLSTAIGRLLARRRGQQLGDLKADLVVPVPMHWTRRLRRGTNSAEILAQCLGQYLKVPVRRRVLWRCRNTLPQADLPPPERFKNVRGAFRVRASRRLEGVRVALVDDILTTGATCSEAARMLKKAGASMVAAVVLARSEGTNST